MPASFQGFNKRKLLKALTKCPTGLLNVQQATSYLLSTYKLANSWQKQYYNLDADEENAIAKLGLLKMLIPFSFDEYPASFLLLEDEKQYMFHLDSFINMLCSRIKDVYALSSFRSFLHENSGLDGFSVVAKDYYNATHAPANSFSDITTASQADQTT
ncbi:hypothetical protein [Hymenobacter ruber]